MHFIVNTTVFIIVEVNDMLTLFYCLGKLMKRYLKSK